MKYEHTPDGILLPSGELLRLESRHCTICEAHFRTLPTSAQEYCSHECWYVMAIRTGQRLSPKKLVPLAKKNQCEEEEDSPEWEEL